MIIKKDQREIAMKKEHLIKSRVYATLNPRNLIPDRGQGDRDGIFQRVLCLLLFCMALSFSLHSLADAEEISAQLTRKTQLVEDQKAKETAWQEAQLQQIFSNGDSLRTGKDSFAQLNLTDGSVVRMASLSQVTLNPPQREVKFSLGKILLKFFRGAQARVVTPTTVAATLGTVWVHELDGEGKSTVHVVEGKIAFTSGGTTQTVEAGQFSVAPLNQPPLPPQPFDVAQYIKTEPLFEGLEGVSPQQNSTNSAQDMEQISPSMEPVVPPAVTAGGMGPTGQPLPPPLPPWYP